MMKLWVQVHIILALFAVINVRFCVPPKAIFDKMLYII